MKYGYARVSTVDQSLDIQKAALTAAGCEMIRGERVSATSAEQRVELRSILDFIRQGDQLVVTRVDRLARSMGDLQDIMRELRRKGASLVITEQQIDTSTAAGKAFLDMLGVFAEFETNLRRDRQMEGIAKARAAGAYKGRAGHLSRRLPDRAAFVARSREIGVTAAAREANIGISTAYRIVKQSQANSEASAA